MPIFLYSEMEHYKNNKNQGFTMVELSIALVIISIVLVGIIGTRDLLREATLRKDATLIASYATAVNQFKEKYDAFPGDMPNATALLPSTSFPIINGNGNRIIECSGSSPPNAAGQECVQALVQLSLTGFIPGGYTGRSGTLQKGDNVVDANNGIVLGFTSDAGAGQIYGRRGNMISFTAPDPTQPFCFWCTLAFSAQDAYEIDTKLDDGLPSTGYLVGIDMGITSNQSTLAASNTNYYYQVSNTMWGGAEYNTSAFAYSRYRDSNNNNPTPDRLNVARLFYFLN